jgi:hypothetical protein
LLADVGDDPSYHKGTLIYTEPDGSEVQIDIRARARGNFRKRPENCDFPPLKIQFSEEDTPGTLFSGISDLKIVSHCQSGFPEFEQYVLQEFLIYRLYNIFTDISFRVRLVRIRYIDQGSSGDSVFHFAFFLENPEAMAARNGCTILELGSVPPDRLDQEQYILIDFFNYMIINTDYSIPVVHNIELISRGYFEPPIPVPFDFDWSGLINIPYSYSYTGGNLSPAREFKGPCRKRKAIKNVIAGMQEKRPEVYQLYITFPYLAPDVKTRVINDLNSFYETIENRRLVRQEFIKKCKE